MTQTNQVSPEDLRKARQLISCIRHLNREYRQKHLKDPVGILLNPDDVDLLMTYEWSFTFGPDIDRIIGIPFYRSVDMPSGSVGCIDQIG